MPAEDFYKLSKEELFSKLGTSEKGLAEAEVQKRLERYGQNKLTAKRKVSPLEIFITQFKNNLILILIGAAFLVFFVYFFGSERDQSDLIEGGLILAIVLMITVLGFVQEYKAEKAVEALKKMLAFNAKVIRDGKEHQVDVAMLVPGDIVILEEGEKAPADIRLLQVSNLSTLEASLTGESTPVSKIVDPISETVQIGDQKNMIFSSTIVASGRGLGVVVKTGDLTEIGKIASSVAQVEDEETPIQKRLDQIGKALGYIVLGICAVVFVFIVFFAQEFQKLELFERVITSFIAAISLAVAAIPEGLPAVVTIALALGTQRMLARRTLVRKLNSVETLGSTDVICSDKTGTLTKNEMTVQELYFNDQDYKVSGTGYDKIGEFTRGGEKVDPKELQLLLTIGLACNDATFEGEKLLGDPTEGALLVAAAKAGVTADIERVKEIPFSSARKMMSVADQEGSETLVYVKGAPEVILEHCDKIIAQGKEIELDQQEKEKVLQKVEEMSKKALRTLAFAYKKTQKVQEDQQMESNLVFVGLQGMIDPPRTEIEPLVNACNSSGIRTIMITGDHKATATAVAHKVGIEGKSISGEELDKLSPEELTKVVQEVDIYARVDPSFKMKIVEILQKHGHIVAMTGDGVNDAPAVKRADIGIAMGITGTDVAKEASDMVLLDDNFSTIVAAIEEGRGIFANIRKFVDYLLSCNIAEVLVVFFALVIFGHLPLTAIMLLWINVITDGLPAVALGLDPAEKNIMRYPPSSFQEQIINKRLWVEMIVFGILLTVGVLGIYWHNIPEGLEEARAAAFMAIVVFELVRLLIIRADHNTPLFSNVWLIVAVVVSLLLQSALVYVPFLANLFEIKQIDLFDWVYMLIGSFVLWLIFELIRKLTDSLSILDEKD